MVAFTNKNENNDELLVKILKMCPHLANLTIKEELQQMHFLSLMHTLCFKNCTFLVMK